MMAPTIKNHAQGKRASRYLTRAALIGGLALLASLAGCATTYTVDDGRKVDETLLAQIRTYGDGERALTPAIVKSAELHDKDCAAQYVLPFDTATSAGFSEDVKVAWIRALGVDEHLRVVAVGPGATVSVGDIIAEVDGYSSDNARKMLIHLRGTRDDGKPFQMKLGSGAVVTTTPLKVCRGIVEFQWPGRSANDQFYHWLGSAHPLEVAGIHLTPGEAEWVVLWTQGLSEEGVGRMRTYSYVLSGAKAVAGSVLSNATMGAGQIAGNAASVAGSAFSTAVGHIVMAETPGILAQATTAASANAANLHGLNWVASSAFDEADKWAFEHMSKLGMDPRTGLELQIRLVKAGAIHNGLLFDDARLKQMETLASALPPAQTAVAGAAPESAPTPSTVAK
jgi:hypothetical protein